MENKRDPVADSLAAFKQLGVLPYPISLDLTSASRAVARLYWATYLNENPQVLGDQDVEEWLEGRIAQTYNHFHTQVLAIVTGTKQR